MKRKSPLKQSKLNFGQKLIAKTSVSSKCEECGMIYNKGDEEDEQLHVRFHSEQEKLLNYPNYKGEKIVQQYFDGKCVVIESGLDSKQMIHKACQILAYVDRHLGVYNIFSKNEIEINRDENNLPDGKCYLFVCALSKRIVGFCLAEKIEKAHQILYLDENKEMFGYEESEQAKAVCGISRIWVSEKMRRHKIASRLLDCVRINFLYMNTLEPHEIAFSDPTHFGQCLAKSYCATNSFLIYSRKQ
jgi:hypothetical protein